MNTNVRSVIELTKLAVPHLAKTKGNICNVSSISGLRVRANFLPYCISEAAIDQFTKSAALDLGPKGIRVQSIQLSFERQFSKSLMVSVPNRPLNSLITAKVFIRLLGPVKPPQQQSKQQQSNF